jgi:uncharacterized protein YraI
MKRLVRVTGLVITLVSLILVQTNLSFASASQQTFAPPILVVNTSFLNVRTGPSASFSVATTVVGGTELPVLGAAGDNTWYQVSTPVGVGWVNIEFTVPRGDFRNVPLVSVDTQPNAPVIIDAGNNNAGAVVAAPATTTTANQPVAASNTIIYRGAVNQTTNAYASPSVGAVVNLTLYDANNDTDYPIVDAISGWVALDLPQVGVSWIEENKVIIRLARTTERDVVVINVGTVGFDLSPGQVASGPSVLSEGTEAYLLNITPDAQKVEIQLADGTTGFVPFSAVRTRTGTTTDENPIPVTNAPASQAPTTGPGPIVDTSLGQGGGPNNTGVFAAPSPQLNRSVVVVNTSFLNIRSGPGSIYTQVFTARGGSQFEVLGIASDGVWFLVAGPFGQGWVNNEFVVFRGDIASVPIIRDAAGVVSTPIAVIGSSAQLYAAPGTNFGLLGTVPGPVEAPIVARTSDFQWVQINTSAGFGWVLASQVTIRGDANLIPVVTG